MKHRPWGLIDWTLNLSTRKLWHFVGALGTEERSLGCWKYLRSLNLLSGETFVEIQDVDSEKYRRQNQNALRARRGEFTNAGGNANEIESIELMAEDFRILDFARRIAIQGVSIILDITSLPKRYFFPLLRELIVAPTVDNLLITYTSPDSYPQDSPLYEDPEPWRVLPGFGGGLGKPELWIVSVGFLVESLRKYVGDNPDEMMKLLIPFPAPLAALRRTWESVAALEQDHTNNRFEKFRVDTLDLSFAFDRVCALAERPPRLAAFAPFGPKPISAAMCIYATQRGSSVHYPQPTIYHPNYSIGIRQNDPTRAVTAYWIKQSGEFLYSI